MWFFHSAVQAIFDLQRKCRKCGNKQMVPLKDKNKTVRCTKCGEPIKRDINRV